MYYNKPKSSSPKLRAKLSFPFVKAHCKTEEIKHNIAIKHIFMFDMCTIYNMQRYGDPFNVKRRVGV